MIAATNPESAVLGAMILDPVSLIEGIKILKPELFGSPRNRVIFDALIEMRNNQRPVDLITLTDFLREKERVSSAGGADYISTLVGDSTGGLIFDEHVRVFKGEARRRLAYELLAGGAFQLKNGAEFENTIRDVLSKLSEIDDARTRSTRLKSIAIRDFLSMAFPPRKNIIDPILPCQGLGMIHGFRGTGKTHLGLGIAYAVSGGGEFLCWRAPEPKGVLYIDGEMPGNVMQGRLAELVKASPYEPKAPLILITPDLQKTGLPDLGTVKGQNEINGIITEEIKLVIVDNLSCLVRTGKENEADSWQPVQSWALGLRSHGVSVLFLHHSSKTGGQRGTSRREDVLDTVINLRRPVDYNPESGAVFEVHFEKARGLHGADVAPFEAALRTDDEGNQIWLTRSLELCTYDKVISLANDGLSQKDIAEELGLNKSTVSRYYRKALSDGDIRERKKNEQR